MPFKADFGLFTMKQPMPNRSSARTWTWSMCIRLWISGTRNSRLNRMFRSVSGADDPHLAVDHLLARAAVAKLVSRRVFLLGQRFLRDVLQQRRNHRNRT